MTFQAAIFDMDGLLLDTERLCMRIFKEACAIENLPFFEEVYLSIIGRNATGIERIFRKVYGDDLDRLDAQWRRNYHQVVKNQPIPVKKGVKELLNWLKGNHIATAVATSTENSVAKRKLELARLDHYFDAMATGCEVKQGKPCPEIFLLAANRLNVAPSSCLAFEDSNNGVRSAVAANMITYQVPDLVQPDAEIMALGHRVLPSMTDVLAELKR